MSRETQLQQQLNKTKKMHELETRHRDSKKLYRQSSNFETIIQKVVSEYNAIKDYVICKEINTVISD